MEVPHEDQDIARGQAPGQEVEVIERTRTTEARACTTKMTLITAAEIMTHARGPYRARVVTLLCALSVAAEYRWEAEGFKHECS